MLSRGPVPNRMVNTLCCSTCQHCIRAAWDGNKTQSAILKSCLAEEQCVLPHFLLACGVVV